MADAPTSSLATTYCSNGSAKAEWGRSSRRGTRLGRIVALKVLPKERIFKPRIVERFYREIQAAACLSHPNIVHAYDAEQIGDTHIFAMEYVEGIDLARLVKQAGPLPVAAGVRARPPGGLGTAARPRAMAWYIATSSRPT